MVGGVGGHQREIHPRGGIELLKVHGAEVPGFAFVRAGIQAGHHPFAETVGGIPTAQLDEREHVSRECAAKHEFFDLLIQGAFQRIGKQWDVGPGQ